MDWDNLTQIKARARHFFLITMLCFFSNNIVLATEQGGAVSIKVYGDHILIPVTFKTAGLTKTTHIILDYANHESFGLHKNVYDSLIKRLGKNEKTLKIHFDSFNIEVPVKDITNKPSGTTPMDALTEKYDVELQNVDISAIIGYPILKNYSIKINLHDKQIEFTPSSIEHATKVQNSAEFYLPSVKVVQNNLYVPVSAKGSDIGLMEFQTAGYHTSIKPEVAANFDLSKDLVIGRVDKTALLSSLVAVRKQDLPKPVTVYGAPAKQGEKPPVIYQQRFPSNRVMKSGLGLWSNYAVEVDANIGFMALTRLVDSLYSEADAAFYQASHAKDWNGLITYINQYPKDRNIEEAVAEAATIGLDTNVSHNDFIAVIKQGAESQKIRSASDYYFGYAQQANQEKYANQHNDIVISLAEESLNYISRAQTPRNRESIQRLLGDIYLDQGDAHTAWKYYLSASFNGDPEQEAQTRMGLANSYAALKRYRRAYSNYQRVAKLIPEQFHEQIGLKKAMTEVRKHLKPNDPLLESE